MSSNKKLQDKIIHTKTHDFAARSHIITKPSVGKILNQSPERGLLLILNLTDNKLLQKKEECCIHTELKLHCLKYFQKFLVKLKMKIGKFLRR